MLRHESLVSGYIFLGDAVNYGPWSNECVELISELPNAQLIIGNHDQYFLDGICPVKNDMVQMFFEKCFTGFTREKELLEYKETDLFGEFNLCHTINNQYIFEDTTINIHKNYIIGHSHYQFKRVVNNWQLINVGSVGQNRGYINVINYGIYDLESREVFLKQLPYDVDIVICEMKARHFPTQCVDYYKNKKRLK